MIVDPQFGHVFDFSNLRVSLYFISQLEHSHQYFISASSMMTMLQVFIQVPLVFCAGDVCVAEFLLSQRVNVVEIYLNDSPGP